ncbi:MAG TPA: hypothetical protein VGH91_04380 [Gammaproteobacteria bacterium]|jgi:hypothetical protein
MTELKRLKVGRRCYRVVRQHMPKDYGSVNFNRGIIRIDDPQPPGVVVDTVLHELLHAIWADFKLPDRPTEERAVTALAQGLMAVFRDNPGLATYIERLIGKER